MCTCNIKCSETILTNAKNLISSLEVVCDQADATLDKDDLADAMLLASLNDVTYTYRAIFNSF